MNADRQSLIKLADDASDATSTEVASADGQSSADSTVEATIDREAVRELAIAILPELAKHQWNDCYFDNSSEHEIIAVFDHVNSKYKSMDFYITTSFLMAMQGLGYTAVAAIVPLLGGLLYFLFLLFVIAWLGIGLEMIVMLLRMQDVHTAVTVDGVVHKADHGNVSFTIPLKAILDIDESTLKLADDFRSYKTSGMCQANIAAERHAEYPITGLKDPALFRKIVLAMRDAASLDDGYEPPALPATSLTCQDENDYIKNKEESQEDADIIV
ncbi:hypothetical protein MPSEU_000687000 [Mayamaea pseudoterrestris]|nr:hypothetical protein MPSEU_000687000 [Mayamaea pseudoterrestris]